jgi:hypothetical protein
LMFPTHCDATTKRLPNRQSVGILDRPDYPTDYQ